MPASSERRSAPAKPTSSSARSRRPGTSSGIGASSSRSTASVAARFFCGLGASRRMPAMVSDTSAVSVGGGEAGGAVQETDGGGAQFQRVAGLAAIAPGGEEGGNIAGRRGQGRDPVLVAPGAPGAYRRAVGRPRVVGLGAAAIGAGGFVRPRPDCHRSPVFPPPP